MSAPSLCDLQTQFSHALHYQAYDLPIATGLAEPDALLQIYRNNFVVTLSECLDTVYPVVKALVGCECFEALARHHVLSTPMTSASADQYGEGFNATIASIPNIVEAVPYLADIAKLEWLRQCVNQVPIPKATFPIEMLQQIRPEEFEQIRLSVSPATAVMTSAFPISTVWHAVSNNDTNTLEAVDITRAEAVWVQHTPLGVLVDTIDANEARLIDACKQQELGLIEPTQLTHLTAAMQRGAFIDFTLVHRL
ncbi:DNA-binding domain-containing protein [Enterovibrio nigricans]|uniref:Putative DNA-binding domain-containing protein n=1 Tax=Enterovibrio nigricans DSM 22720 TaxID=1121868 RepID=A0A1T4U9I7_9GAMM|nr:DNA-binding domain-containing protein [Enterovibrio nigricans]PKF51370.1 DUF2063 domain-containing protein [Enterovibrio nigricans]SKA49442.1 Putative DNA-binding domain-containing protein [Enterovibrio nigricans DSM 22720]